jgi:hypothetical protein
MDQSYGDCRDTCDTFHWKSTGGNRYIDSITDFTTDKGSATTAADDTLRTKLAQSVSG